MEDPAPDARAASVDAAPTTVRWLRRLVRGQLAVAGLAVVLVVVLAAIAANSNRGARARGEQVVLGGLETFLAVGFVLVALVFVVALAVPLFLVRDRAPRPLTRRLLWLVIGQIAAAVPAFLFGVILLASGGVGGLLPLVEVAVAAAVVVLATRPPSLEWAARPV